MKWNKESINTLINMYNDGHKYAVIGEHFGVSSKAISVRISDLRKLGQIKTHRNVEWTAEEDEELKFLRREGFTINEICDFMPTRTFYSIAERFNSLDEKKHVMKEQRFWTDEELLDLVRRYNTLSAYSSASTSNKDLPSPKTITTRFDGWRKAVRAAGLSDNKAGGMDVTKPTKLYLVKFVEENFLKLGLTQRTVKQRFYGFPKYEILFEAEYEYATAKQKEYEWLVKLAPHKYIPENPIFKGKGHTECFRL